MSVCACMLSIGRPSVITQLFSNMLFFEVGLNVIVITIKNFHQFKNLEFSLSSHAGVVKALLCSVGQHTLFFRSFQFLYKQHSTIEEFGGGMVKTKNRNLIPKGNNRLGS